MLYESNNGRCAERTEDTSASAAASKCAAYTTNPPRGLPCGFPWSNWPHGKPRGKPWEKNHVVKLKGLREIKRNRRPR